MPSSRLAKLTCSVTAVASTDTLPEIAHIPGSKRAMEKAKGCKKGDIKGKGKGYQQ